MLFVTRTVSLDLQNWRSLLLFYRCCVCAPFNEVSILLRLTYPSISVFSISPGMHFKRRVWIWNIQGLRDFITRAVAHSMMWQFRWSWYCSLFARPLYHRDRNFKASSALQHSRSQVFYYRCCGPINDLVISLQLKYTSICVFSISPGPQFRGDSESETFRGLRYFFIGAMRLFRCSWCEVEHDYGNAFTAVSSVQFATVG